VGTYISKDGVSKQGEWINGRKIRWIGGDTDDQNQNDFQDE